MYRIAAGFAESHPDVRTFVDTLNRLDRSPFDRSKPLTLTRAPGRLDVMGGIADYSGSLVLEMPTQEAVVVALQRRPQRTLHIESLTADADRDATVELPLAAFETATELLAYADVRAMFAQHSRTRWAAYVAGAFVVLMRECGARFADGATLLIASDVPEGKGVSSSAAIEVATMQAIAAAYGIRLDAVQLAVLCQKVENLVVGAPCGLMDQMTSACGEAHRLLALLCQPADLQGTVEIPDDVEFWGIDSGVRHSVAGADYGSVRVGAFMGYRIIAEMAGLFCKMVSDGNTRIDDPIWRGYLANVSPAVFESRFRDRLPESIIGREFLECYGGTTDAVTTIDPARTYAVRNPTAHPIYEHFRVRAFAELLGGHPADVMDAQQLALLGELMYQSHASYSACGLGCAGTDLLVDLVRQAGLAAGLYGAKITGGGSGGTVVVLARRGSGAAIQAVADSYARQTGHRPHLFSGSSSGAAGFGHLQLINAD